jgi:hypothetical protein
MLIVAAFVLLLVGLVLLFLLSSRRVREFWPGATLIAGAAVLVSLHARAQRAEARHLDEAIRSECAFLSVALDSDVGRYRWMHAPNYAGPPSAVTSSEDEYRGAFDARAQLIRLCTPIPPAWNPSDCLPAAITRESVPRILAAATSIRDRKRCDTR